MNIKLIIFIICLLLSMGLGLLTVINAHNIYSEPGVHYLVPMNDYERAVEETNNYCPVYENNISDTQKGNVDGQTVFINGKPNRIIIEKQEDFIVYHELAHVRWNATEKQADEYASKRTNNYSYPKVLVKYNPKLIF